MSHAYLNGWPIVVFCSLVAVESVAAIQHKLFIEFESSADGGDGECDSIKEQYWKLIQWFYGMVNIVFVNSIVNSNNFHIPHPNSFVKEISERKVIFFFHSMEMCMCVFGFNENPFMQDVIAPLAIMLLARVTNQ